jgi:thymidylate synthase
MMETQYLNLLHDVLQNGHARVDRTGVGTLSCFGRQIRCDLKDGFPLLTTKKMGIKSIAGELLWFLSGSSDERRLAEITHGTRAGAVTIWTPNSLAPYWKSRAKFDGDVGRIYGVQWRGWKKYNIKSYEDLLDHHDGSPSTTYFGAKVSVESVDQIKNIIETIKKNPSDRRMVLTAFNVGELEEMALPPCHMMAQFYVGKRDELSCQVYIRSNDLFLGLPYNIASYALLTHMMAQVTDKGVGELIITIGDAHIYKNHVTQVKEQLSRGAFPPPRLHLNPVITNIDDFKMNDIEIVDYVCHPTIRGEMAV